MDIFKKTIKYSKPSIEIDNKIKDLNEGLKKTKSTLSEQKFSEEEVDEILSEQIVDVENWKEFSSRTYNNYQITIQNSHLNLHPDAQCNYNLGQGRGSGYSRERTLE